VCPSQQAAARYSRPAAHRLVESRLRLPDTIVLHERTRWNRRLLYYRVSNIIISLSLSLLESAENSVDASMCYIADYGITSCGRMFLIPTHFLEFLLKVKLAVLNNDKIYFPLELFKIICRIRESPLRGYIKVNSQIRKILPLILLM